jgi:Fic family protein
MESFQADYLRNLPISHRLLTTIRQIGEYKGKQQLYQQQSPEVLENLRNVAIIQSTESSNRLEGITATYRRIKEIVEEKTAPANRSEGEIAGYRDVLTTIHMNYEHIPFAEGVVLQFHRDLMKYSGKEGGAMEIGLKRDIRDTSRWLETAPFCPGGTAPNTRVYATAS